MPEYLSPGVYIEERLGLQTIAGVSTSTTGMVGVTQKGPTEGKPVFVDSLARFREVFGGFLPAPELDQQVRWLLDDREGGAWWLLPLAVKGFFDNGGRRLYIKRVVSAQATAAEVEIGSGVVADPPAGRPDALDLAAGANLPALLRAAAKAKGDWGNDLSVRVMPERARRIPAVSATGTGPIATTLAEDIDGTANAVIRWPDRLDGVQGPVQVVISGQPYQVATLPTPANGQATLVLAPAPEGRIRRGTPVKILRQVDTGAANQPRRVPLSRTSPEAVYVGALVLVGPAQARGTGTAGGEGRPRTRRRRPVGDPHPGRLRRAGRRQRPAYRGPGDGGPAGREHRGGTGDLVAYRAECPRRALRAAAGPLRHPRPADAPGHPGRAGLPAAVGQPVRRAVPPLATGPGSVVRPGRRRPTVGAHGRRLRPRRRAAGRTQGAGERGHRADQRVRRRRQPARAGPAQPERDQRAARVPQPGAAGVGGADAQLAAGVEVRQRTAAVHLHRELHQVRDAVGRLRAQRRGAVGAGTAVDHELPRHRVAHRGATGHQAGGGVLRAVRPHHDERRGRPGRAADRRDRDRRHHTCRVRHLPLPAEDP